MSILDRNWRHDVEIGAWHPVLLHFGQSGYAFADRISKALPPPVAAKDIPLAGIVDPDHERYGEASEARSLKGEPWAICTVEVTAMLLGELKSSIQGITASR